MFALFCASRNALTIEPRRVSLLSNRMRANSCSAAFSVSGLWISGLLVFYTISLLSTLKSDLQITMFALFCASQNHSFDDYMGASFVLKYDICSCYVLRVFRLLAFIYWKYFSFLLSIYLCRRLKTWFRVRMSFLLRASKYPSYPIGWLFSQLAKRTTSLQTCPVPFCAWKISTDSLLLFCSKSGHLECSKFTAAARCVQSLFQNSNKTQTCLGVSAVAGLYIRKMIPLVHRCHRIPCLRILWGSSALSLYIYRAENCSSITKTAISLDKNIRSSA